MIFAKNSEGKDAERCDSCGQKVEKGAAFISGIESCCGGCYRSLCWVCVIEALRLLLEAGERDDDLSKYTDLVSRRLKGSG